jgi:hypothetical protein
MRVPFAILLAILFIIPDTGRSVNPSDTNKYVRFTATLKPGAPRTGSTGALLFNLYPRKGIHVNLTPPMSVTFDSSAPVKAAGKLQTPAMEKFPYLDTSKAIVQRFTLLRKAKPPTGTIRGTLTYFYCSDSEGWCSKFKQPFELTMPATK